MGFVLIHFGIGWILAHGLATWEVNRRIKYNDKSFTSMQWIEYPLMVIFWFVFIWFEDIRNTCYEGLGEL